MMSRYPAASRQGSLPVEEAAEVVVAAAEPEAPEEDHHHHRAAASCRESQVKLFASIALPCFRYAEGFWRRNDIDSERHR